MRRSFGMSILSLVVLAACGGGGDELDPSSFNQPFEDVEAYPVVVSSELVVGENRLLVGLLDDQDRRIASPDIDVGVRFFDLNGEEARPQGRADMEFVWTIEPVQGVYVTEASFDRPGDYGIEVSIQGDGYDETVRTGFEVAPEGSTPALGEVPPESDTPTRDDVKDLSRITTDPDPDPRFYEMSLAEAIRSPDPAVVVFATPKFCTSQVCGPTLDIVKEVSTDFPKTDFVHVEVYELPADPAQLKLVPAVEQWGLPSEPWVFVLDRQGRVAAKYEGTVGAEELREELEQQRA